MKERSILGLFDRIDGYLTARSDVADIVARHRAEIINKEVALNGLRERESELKATFELLTQQNEELTTKLKTAQEELQTASTTSEDEVFLLIWLELKSCRILPLTYVMKCDMT